MNHLITLKSIAEEFQNDKANHLCSFIDFRKAFGITLRTKLWKMVEDVMVLLKLRVVGIRLHKNVISKFRTTEFWLEEI